MILYNKVVGECSVTDITVHVETYCLVQQPSVVHLLDVCCPKFLNKVRIVLGYENFLIPDLSPTLCM